MGSNTPLRVVVGGIGMRPLLPVVQRMINEINQLFVEFVGPIAHELINDEFYKWSQGEKVGPSALRHYVIALSLHLDNPSERARFIQLSGKIFSSLM